MAPAFFSSRSRRSSTDCSLNLKAPMMIYFLVALADLTSERNQRTLRRVDWTVFFRRLLQEVEQLRAELDGGVDGLVGAFVVRANQIEIFFLPVRRFETNRRVGCRTMFLRDHVIANAALALEHVDRRIVTGGGELTGEDDVAVENGTSGGGNRFVEIVAVDEHGVETRDAALVIRAGALEEARKRREHGRRITLGCRRLAAREADLTPRHRDSRRGVGHQRHFLALRPEVFGARRRGGR